MTRNKHKNGIVCTFPGCAKTMRTQKFKPHFLKLHLQPGEVYTVEHRRRFEVAREDDDGDGGSTSLAIAPALHASLTPHPFADTSASASAEEVASNNSSTSSDELTTSSPSPLRHPENTALTSVTAQSQPLRVTGLKRQAAKIAGTETTPSLPVLGGASVTKARAGTRTASASSASPAMQNPPRAVLVKYIEMMDVRFHELIQKMGQVIDGQRELIELLRRPLPAETVELLEQTPALGSADASATKRRKSDGSGSDHGNGDAATLI